MTNFLRQLLVRKSTLKSLRRAGGIVRLIGAGIGSLAVAPTPLLACSVCYGQSDSPMAQGLNWGILSLLSVVVVVLGGFAGFFIYLANRSTLPSTAAPSSEPLLASARKI
jgi:hypothetical protein